MDIWWDGMPGLDQIISHCLLEKKVQYDLLGPYAQEYDMDYEVRALQEEHDVERVVQIYYMPAPYIHPKGSTSDGSK